MNSSSQKPSLEYPNNNLDPIGELEKYEKAFGKYFTHLDLEFAEYTLSENNKFSCLNLL